MREIITSTSASLFTACVLVAQIVASGPSTAAPAVRVPAPAVAAR